MSVLTSLRAEIELPVYFGNLSIVIKPLMSYLQIRFEGLANLYLFLLCLVVDWKSINICMSLVFEQLIQSADSACFWITEAPFSFNRALLDTQYV